MSEVKDSTFWFAKPASDRNWVTRLSLTYRFIERQSLPQPYLKIFITMSTKTTFIDLGTLKRKLTDKEKQVAPKCVTWSLFNF